MEIVEEIKSKIDQNKQEKKEKLLNAAYKLFGNVGFNKTSIQDIVNEAGVAKGTFYLYFKNKDDIRNQLLSEKTSELFTHAIQKVDHSVLKTFDQQLIFVIDHVIDELMNKDELLSFIDKDLSIGFYSHELSRFLTGNALGLYDMFIEGVKSEELNLVSPDITFFMIIELISSTCFRCIIKKYPCDIQTFKPHLYSGILALLHNT